MMFVATFLSGGRKWCLVPALLAMLWCGNTLAQADKLVETIEVRVANIEVIVVDDEGRHVDGLESDDFRVLENGEPQTITNFAEFKAESARDDETSPAAIPEAGRSIKILVNVPNATVRTRNQLVLKSTDEELSSRILSCLFRKTCHGEFTVEASAGKPTKARRNRRKVPVEVRVPLVGLTLLPRDHSMVGGMYIHIAAVDENGGFSDVSTQHHRVTVPISDGDDMKDKHVTWVAEILVERGTRDVAISVTDEVSLRSGYRKVSLRDE